MNYRGETELKEIIIFLIDRLTKIYILKLAELEISVDIYLTSYLNLYLIWNKGIAFGLLSMNESLIYNIITAIIGIIILIIFFMIWKKDCSKVVKGNAINSGHYLAEENPDEVIESIKNFL